MLDNSKINVSYVSTRRKQPYINICKESTWSNDLYDDKSRFSSLDSRICVLHWSFERKLRLSTKFKGLTKNRIANQVGAFAAVKVAR